MRQQAMAECPANDILLSALASTAQHERLTYATLAAMVPRTLAGATVWQAAEQRFGEMSRCTQGMRRS